MAGSKASHGFGWLTPLFFFKRYTETCILYSECVYTHTGFMYTHTQVTCCCIKRATEKYKTMVFIPPPSNPLSPLSHTTFCC